MVVFKGLSMFNPAIVYANSFSIIIIYVVKGGQISTGLRGKTENNTPTDCPVEQIFYHQWPGFQKGKCHLFITKSYVFFSFLGQLKEIVFTMEKRERGGG